MREVAQDREKRSRIWLRDKGRKYHEALIGRGLISTFNLPFSFAFPETWHCFLTIPSCSKLIYRCPQHLAQAWSLIQTFLCSPSCLQPFLPLTRAWGCSLGPCSIPSRGSPTVQSLELGHCHRSFPDCWNACKIQLFLFRTILPLSWKPSAPPHLSSSSLENLSFNESFALCFA